MALILLKNSRLILLWILILSILCAVASPNIIILILTLAFLSLLYRYKRHLLLPLTIILLLIFTGQEFEKYRTIVNITCVLILAVMFLKKYGLKYHVYPNVPIQIIYFAVFLTLALSISASLSIDPLSAFLSVLRLLIFFLVCYFYYCLIDNANIIDGYLIAIFISVFLIGISVLIEIYKTGFVFFLIGGTINRYGGIYDNPNYVGLLLLITIPINIALFFRKFNHPRFIRFTLILLLVISTILLIVSNSRSSIIGTIVASAITIAYINKKVFFKFISILTLTLIIFFVVNEFQDYLALYFRLDRVGNREYFWNAGLDIISDHPYFGVGPELFDRYFFTYMPSSINQLYESGSWSVGRPHPHNFFLLFAAENGVLGFISAISFFLLFFSICYKSFLKVNKNKSNDFLLAVAILGIGVGIFIRAFFEVTGIITYGFITRDLPFWLLFIIIIHIYQKDKAQIIAKD